MSKLNDKIQRHYNSNEICSIVAGDSISWKRNMSKLKSLPEAYFFNSEGIYFSYKPDTVDCNSSVEQFLDQIVNPNFEFLLNQDRNLNQIVRNPISTFTGVSVDIGQLINKNYKYYVLITWADFIGRVNNDHTWMWLEKIEKINEEHPKTIYPILYSADLVGDWSKNYKVNFL